MTRRLLHFYCSECAGQLAKIVLSDEPGDQASEVVCTRCGRVYEDLGDARGSKN